MRTVARRVALALIPLKVFAGCAPSYHPAEGSGPRGDAGPRAATRHRCRSTRAAAARSQPHRAGRVSPRSKEETDSQDCGAPHDHETGYVESARVCLRLLEAARTREKIQLPSAQGNQYK